MPSQNIIDVQSFKELQRSIDADEAPRGAQMVMSNPERAIYKSEKTDIEIVNEIRALRAKISGGQTNFATFLGITVLCNGEYSVEEVQSWIIRQLATFLPDHDERRVCNRITFKGVSGFGGPTPVLIMDDHRNLASQILAA